MLSAAPAEQDADSNFLLHMPKAILFQRPAVGSQRSADIRHAVSGWLETEANIQKLLKKRDIILSCDVVYPSGVLSAEAGQGADSRRGWRGFCEQKANRMPLEGQWVSPEITALHQRGCLPLQPGEKVFIMRQLRV
jgi:hypothetical protein